MDDRDLLPEIGNASPADWVIMAIWSVAIVIGACLAGSALISVFSQGAVSDGETHGRVVEVIIVAVISIMVVLGLIIHRFSKQNER